MRLLIADSDPVLADIYHSFFSKDGHDVKIAADGLQCLERIREHLPSVLVLEYELPWGGGDGVLANLREKFPFARIGVVLTTCDYSAEDISEELTPPVVTYLRKPFRLGELREAVRSITEQKSASASGLLKYLTIHGRRAIE